MADIKLGIKVSVSEEDARRRLAALAGDFTQLKEKVRGELNRSATAFEPLRGAARSVSEQLQSIQGVVATTVGAFAAFRQLNQLRDLADQYALLNARLKLTTDSQHEFNAAQGAVQAIAQRTRSELEDVAVLYGKVNVGVKALGGNQAQTAAITEAVTQSFKLSGASAGAAAGAIQQLSQSLASGTLRGDEFNSVMEAGPRLSKALADGLGVPVGALRGLAEEGKLSTDKVLAALLSQRDQLASEFATLPKTAADAAVETWNAFLVAWGSSDTAGQLTGLYRSAFEGLAANAKLAASAIGGSLVVALTYATGRLVQFGAAQVAAHRAQSVAMAEARAEIVALMQANLAVAQAENAAAVATLRRAETLVMLRLYQLQDAQAAAARATGMQRLALIETEVAAATRAHAAALAQLTTAQAAATTATTATAAAQANLATATTTATVGLRGLMSTANLTNAALVGMISYQVGRWAVENFETARNASYYFTQSMMVSWERIKQAVESFKPALVLTLEGAFDAGRRLAASFYEMLAAGFAKLPNGLGGGVAASMQGMADEIRGSIGKAGDAAGAELDAIAARADAAVARIKEGFGDLLTAPMGKPAAPDPQGDLNAPFKAPVAAVDPKAAARDAQKLREEALRAELERMRLEAEAHRESLDAKLAYEKAAAEKIKAVHGETSIEYLRALRQVQDTEREIAEQKSADALDQIQFRARLRLEELSNAQELMRAELTAGRLSQEQALAAEREFARLRYEIKRQALLDEQALYQNGPAPDARKAGKTRQDIQILDTQREGEKGREGDRKADVPFTAILQQMQTGFEQALTGMLTRAQTWRQALSSMWSGLSKVFIQELVTKPLAAWVAGQARGLAVAIATKTKELIFGKAAAEKEMATTVATSTVKISANAATAATGAASAMAPIPIVGPALALGAMAMMFAAVLAMRGKMASAAGGYDIPSGINPITQLHAQEMVLPAKYANLIRGMAEGSRDDAGPSAAPMTVTVHAVDAQSVARLFRDHRGPLANALREHLRNNAV